MRALLCVVVATGLAFGSGCKKKSAARLVSDAELAQLQTEHAAKLQAFLAASCDRPVLRGEATPGNGTEALRALGAWNDGPHAACSSAFETKDDASELLLDCAPGMDPARCPARSLSDATEQPRATALLASCKDIAPAVQAAVAYGTVCSPFRPSKGPADPEMLGYIRASKVAALQARQIARDGAPGAALDLVMDTARMAQDVDRPGAGLISAMISVASMGAPMSAAEAILNSKFDWPAAGLDTAVNQADALRASQVPWHATLAGEGLYMVEQAARQLRGEVPAAEPTRLAPQDEYGVTWIALRGWSKATERACAAGTSLKQCIENTRTPPALDDEVASQLSSKPASEVRGKIVAILGDLLGTLSTPKYARRYALGVARTIALRAHLEYVRMTATARQCPDAAAATAALTPLLASKELGDPLTTFVAPDGTIEVRLPEWAVEGDDKGLTMWRIRCP
jgi:hypothetical protein